MNKHTPGPWTYAIDNEYSAEVFVNDQLPGRAVIAEIATQPEREANAALIAKAPELLVALTHLANEVSGWDMTALRALGGYTNTAVLLTRRDEARALITEIEKGAAGPKKEPS